MSSINGPSGPCGACKFLRRKCVVGCIFAPYFDSEEGAARFAAVHKVFGASNVSKLLLQVPFHKRLDTVVTICYEAQARLRDPIFGCVSQIFALQQQVVNLQAELSIMQAQSSIDVRPPPPPPPPTLITPSLSIADLPSASTGPTTYDLSSLFEPMVLQPWASTQHRSLNPCQIGGSGTTASSSGCDGGGDLHALAHELLHRHNSPPLGRSIPIFHVSPPPSLSES